MFGSRDRHKDYEGAREHLDFSHGRSRAGGDKGQKQLLEDRFSDHPDAQIIFIGSLNCLRHKPFSDIGNFMRKGKAAVLTPSMSDFSSGRYLNQLEEAILELSEERGAKDFVVVTGCQWTILSSDGDLLVKQLKNEHGIDLLISDDNHLTFGDHE